MDTAALRIVLGMIAGLAALYLIWPQIAVWRDRIREPGCGRCRYPVRGIAALVCPECGADLRIEGILTPGMMMRRRRTVRASLALWTLVASVAGFVLALAVNIGIPGRIQSVKRMPLAAVADAALTLDLTLQLEGWTEPPADRVFTLGLAGGSPRWRDAVSVAWPEARVTSAAGDLSAAIPTRGSTLDAGALEAWFRARGVPSPEIAAADAHAALLAMAAQPYNMTSTVPGGTSWTPGGSSASVRRYTPIWAMVGGAGLWLACWAVGVMVVLRRWARRAAPRPGHASATLPVPTPD